jgi:hypothetical protein
MTGMGFIYSLPLFPGAGVHSCQKWLQSPGCPKQGLAICLALTQALHSYPVHCSTYYTLPIILTLATLTNTPESRQILPYTHP